MKPSPKGSLLSRINAPLKAAKRVDDKFKRNDLIPEDKNSPLSDMHLPHEAQVKSDSLKKESRVVSSNYSSDHSQDYFNQSSFNSAERDKNQMYKKFEQTYKLNSKKTYLLGPSNTKKSNDDSTVNYGSRLPQFEPTGVPQGTRVSKQRSVSNSNANLVNKPKPLKPSILENQKEKKSDEPKEQPEEKDTSETSIQNEDLIKKASEPIRRRLNVNLPITDFEERQMQATTALDMIEKDVNDISENVQQIHDSLIKLSQDSRGVSEKSMDLTQTTEAVLSKVNVMTDWIDGLEKVGSGLKIQLIEWIVKFVSFLSSLLLLLYQTVRKANPLSLFRKKEKKKPPLKVIDDENS